MIVPLAFSFLLTMMVVYTPLSIAFGTLPLDPEIWMIVIAVSLIGLFTPVNLLLGSGRQEICEET
ncbi:MAG: hypothetical protein ACFFEX_18970 [Candidatus Thorarchaeota archaeon]